jgi:thiol:disulfide interchange protein DsbC
MNPNDYQLPQPTPRANSAEPKASGLIRNLLLAFALVGLAGLFVNLAHANQAPSPVSGAAASADLDAVAAGLRAQHPGTRIDSVQFSPIAGLYEVVMGRNVAYMDASGRYALFGHVWDMQTRRDLTADRKALLDRIDVKALDKSLALRHVKGRGTRTLYVFADPQCSFCRQQEQALLALDDVTIYTFVLPILGPESRRIATARRARFTATAATPGWTSAPRSRPRRKRAGWVGRLTGASR